MKKLFTLLTMLIVAITSSWAAEFVLFDGTGSTMPSSSRQADATTGFAYTCANFKSSFTTVSSYTNHGSYVNAIRYGGGTTSSKNHVKLEVPENYTAKVEIVYGGTSTNTKFGISTNGTKPAGSNCDVWNATATASTTLYSATISNLAGEATYYIGGSGDGCVIAYLKVTVESATPAVPTLTGAWKIDETDVTGNTAVAVQGASPAPTMPTFTVGATSGTPTTDNYQVAYSETGDEGIFTYTDGVPTGISTTNAGSATITATLTTKNDTKYLTPETNTFTYTVSISAASAPEINVSGAPAEVVKVGTEVTLTATATGVPTPTITWYNGSDEAVATVVGTVLAYPVPTTTAGTYTFYAKASNGVGDDATSAVQTVVVKEQVATPTFTPNGGYFQESESVTIACAGADAIVYSTDNGETWTSYTEALNITETTTILAKATKQDYIDSEVASATYTKFAPSEIAEVSTATTWDWTSWNQTLQLTATSTPTITDNYTYADIAVLSGTISVPASFAGDKIMFKGQYPVRSKKSQAGTWTIKPSVAGTIKVTFSDTGASIPAGGTVKRYLNINGVNTEYYTERDGDTADKKTTDEIAVPAGDVVITAYGEDGETWQAIVVEKIVFTPFAAQNITVGATGFATVGLPFATTVPAGVTAYAVESVNDSKVKMSSAIDAGTTIPANKGFVIVAAPNTYSFAPVASSSYEGTDILEATGINTKAATTDAPIYVLTITDATNKKIGFKKATTGSLGAYKAYLPGTVSDQASLSVSFDEETAINGIAESEANAEAPVKVIKNGKLFIGNYNVAGQQVK